MKSNTNTKKMGVNRRDFIKGTATAAGAAVAAGSGLMSSQITQANAAADEPPQGTVPQIAPSQIKETITADVVVVGAGISGMCATLSAIEAGAKTVLLEKAATHNGRGFDDGCVNSSVHKEAGVLYDRDEMIGELMKQANYRVDQRLVAVWVDQSGEAIDWLRATVAPKDVKASIGEAAPREGPYKVYRTAINFTGQNAKVLSVLEGLVKEKGGDIRYETPAVQLVRQGSARVTGVIARTAAGSYLQCNARKGIILSTGGYDNNPEMMKRYLRPSDLRIERFNSANKVCTGDGHNMGLAIGADMDEPPHCMIVGNGIIASKDEFYLVMFTPWLRVDKFGRRYVNEDSDYCRQANANAVLPGHFNWSILDSRWGEDASSSAEYVSFVKKQMERYIKDGVVLTAGTIEALAKMIQADPKVFRATVDRYNQLARNKKDLDFGVAGDKMKSVEKPPFYAVQVRNFALVTISGLKINEKMQVLDKEGRVIPGLYASGNTSGGFFGDTYPRNVHGISHGRAITFGRLAGKNAAAEKV
jgi:fumarate reductase flavoprotein subunit